MLSSSRLVAGAFGVALVALGIGFGIKALRSSVPAPDKAPSPQPADTAQQPVASTNADDSEPHEVTPAERAHVSQPPAVVKAVSRAPAAAQTAPVESRVEASPYTRQLVSGLTNVDFTHGPITQEQADQWKRTLQSLTAQGAAAIPAIREFLDQNQEVNFGAMGSALGQTSMRSAFINALGQIGGPEATAALVQTLQSATLPSEIAQLAQVLDQQAPGQHRQETINAINEVLNMASSGQLPANWDVGTLFKLLQTYGDSSSASAVQQVQNSWKYYATMSLAGMEGGQGVPALVQEVSDPAAGSKRDFAFQMLAQVAAQYPDASAALLQQAQAGQVSDSAWRKIAMGLAGDQYVIGDPPGGSGPNADVLPGLKTYHINSGNQNFYSLPLEGNAQVEQRISFINQLMATTSNPTATAALQSALATLTSMVGK
jgi:PBS lyase HEAT-like repeat-containing protein